MLYLKFLDGQGLGNQLWNYVTLRSISSHLGYKYKIINKDEVPTDRSFRDAWTVADSDLTDGVGISTTALP